MKKTLIYFCGMLLIMLTIISCEKEDAGSDIKAVFSYVADGYKVNFTNFSRNTTEYLWDFGDGSNETSTKKSPQHIFKGKGDFLVTLTAKNGAEVSTFIDTVSIIGPNIKIDGDFSDWEYVGYTHSNAESTGGNLRAVKTFASANDINFYIEGTADMNMEIIDLYLDTDNNPLTGFSTWMYPGGSGVEFLCEGSPIGGWGDVLKHSGAPSAWSWTSISSFADAMNFSAIKTSGTKKIIEFSIKKRVLGPMSAAVNFCFIESNAGWAEVGTIPLSQTPTSVFAKIVL